MHELDQKIAQAAECGETTGAIAVVSGKEIFGANIGDSAAWLFMPAGKEELTRVRKPYLGSGVAAPHQFARKLAEGTLVVASDGLWKYTSLERIEAKVRTGNPETLARELAELVRLRSGAFPDDIAVASAPSECKLNRSWLMKIDPRLYRIVADQPYPLLFATISGAHLYGFPSPDSDFDLRGAHVLPLEKVIGLDVRDETLEDSRIAGRATRTPGHAFSESVRAGLLQPYHLAGHRNAPVYIRGSRHVPPPPEAVTDAMSALQDLLEEEPQPIVRAVLGHGFSGSSIPIWTGTAEWRGS